MLTHDAEAPASIALIPDGRQVTDLSFVEIAERLDQVTRLIEAQRVSERQARAAYRAVADEAEKNIAAIRDQARALVSEQRRRMASFDGMLSPEAAGATSTRPASNGALREVKPNTGRGGKMSLTDAILRVWEEGHHDAPLTTEEIAGALRDVGYSTKASARSLKSTMNQALAKLCRDRKLKRYRIDGTEISTTDTRSRARRYMAS
ncbi:MAG TPA: hypothetical protein VD963_09060 [Phycisphaerales bacterium]|nr:hypothetical protein [Phycisphaerales bacterium]